MVTHFLSSKIGRTFAPIPLCGARSSLHGISGTAEREKTTCKRCLEALRKSIGWVPANLAEPK